jgi:hypothetical protein
VGGYAATTVTARLGVHLPNATPFPETATGGISIGWISPSKYVLRVLPRRSNGTQHPSSSTIVGSVVLLFSSLPTQSKVFILLVYIVPNVVAVRLGEASTTIAIEVNSYAKVTLVFGFNGNGR